MKIYQHNSRKFYEDVIRLFLLLAFLTATTYRVIAQNSIEYAGFSFPISEKTVILDREGLLNCPDAVPSPKEAFEKINAMGDQATLLIAPSVYWLDDPDDPEVRSDKGGTPYAIKIKCNELSMIGLSENPEDIVFAVNRGQTQGAVGNFTMFQFFGNSLITKNITFGNYCNVDLVYPRNPNLNRSRRKDAIVQAQIGICEGTDKLFAQNCRFISRLNLCPFVGACRSLYDNCYFECTDDALSGSAVYLDCRFTFFSSKPFYSTAETGAVFLNCDITCLGSGVQYFTKVPGKVTAIDTRFHCDNPIEIQWTRDASDIVCLQENISLNGKPYVIDADRAYLGPSLTESSLRQAFKIENEGKTIYNLPNLLNGNDGWDPLSANSSIALLESQTNTKLNGIPVALNVLADAPERIYNGDKVLLKLTPLLWGGYPSGTVEEFEIVAQNITPEEKHSTIPVSSSDGLTGRYTLVVEPNLREAPEFKKDPDLTFDKKSGKFHVDYALTGKGKDKSIINWTTVRNKDGKIQVVELFRAEAPEGKDFKPAAADLGSSLIAAVTPRYSDSESGLDASTPFFDIDEPYMVEEIPESRLTTNFEGIVILKRLPGIKGAWSFDVYKPADTSHVDWTAADGPGWYYGKGFDASTGTGLVQSEKGARLSYIPARDTCQDMEVSIIAEPAKSGGQGFGSATTQYMDICVKFDPVSLNGYALRIERTPDHDRAVSFSLVKYENGKTNAISEPVISNCYRNPSHISVGVKDGILHASAYTDAPTQDRKCCDEVVEKVELSAPVANTSLTGFCIQHTGSTGPSSTLIRDLNITWD